MPAPELNLKKVDAASEALLLVLDRLGLTHPEALTVAQTVLVSVVYSAWLDNPHQTAMYRDWTEQLADALRELSTMQTVEEAGVWLNRQTKEAAFAYGLAPRVD